MTNFAQPRLRSVLKSHYEDILDHPWDSSRLGPLPLFPGLSRQQIKDHRSSVWALRSSLRPKPSEEFTPLQNALERTRINPINWG